MDLAARVVNTLIRGLPAGTAYFLGIVLIPRFTGQLVHPQGSLARAALPYVGQLRWGWHRVERALERGKFSLDGLFDRAFRGCLECLPLTPVRLGDEQRTVPAIDSSPLVRLRANKKRGAVLGKGYCQRAPRAVKAHMVAALTTVVLVRGGRGGVGRRPRFGATGEEAVAQLCADLPTRPDKRLCSVEAGMATVEQVAAATMPDALVGRLRKHGALRRAPRPRRRGQRGRPPGPGAGLHPGATRPAGGTDADTTFSLADRQVRVRRWHNVHFARAPKTVLDVGRVEDPLDKRPLLIGTPARELRTTELRQAYGHRWPGETHFFVAQGTCTLEQPHAWTELAVSRRSSLALLCGAVLKAIAAAWVALPMGPWDRKAVRTAGRLANPLALYANNFAQLALSGMEPRQYSKTSSPKQFPDLQLPEAA